MQEPAKKKGARVISIAVLDNKVHGYKLQPLPALNQDMRAVWISK